MTPETARANLREAAEEEAEYELDDIIEVVTPQTVKQVVQNNIEFVLRREELLSSDMRVIIAEGAYDYDLAGSEDKNELGHFGGDFTVFDGQHNPVAGGDAIGTIAFDPPELLDLNVRVMEVF